MIFVLLFLNYTNVQDIDEVKNPPKKWFEGMSSTFHEPPSGPKI